MINHIWAYIAISTVALAGCQSTLTGAPEEKYLSNKGGEQRPLLDAVVFEKRLSEAYIEKALDSPTKESRDYIVFSRLAEIDALYGAYENAVLAESRKTGFALSFGSLAAGLLGGYTTGTASRVYSLIGGGISAVHTSYDKEVLAESTIQAFMAQMRAGRSAVRTEIYNNLRADHTKYPIEAALSDLRRYWQAGTLAAAIGGIAEQASQAEIQKGEQSKGAGALLFDILLPDDQTVHDALFKYIKNKSNVAKYLASAEKNGATINGNISDPSFRALEAISNERNSAANAAVAKQLNLL
ncbi:hypothetical protein [Azospirillum lipoferum]|nr:hypothetical protein [Azospirillum lipoferum]